MRNVLLSSIGTGSYNKENGTVNYQTANYVIEDSEQEIVSAYIYDALIEFRNINKIIFIGTAGSNWFLMYEHLFDENSKIQPARGKDEAYAEELLELSEAKPGPAEPAAIDNTHPHLDVKEVREKLQKLKDTMGDICMDIIILHYGITEAEMNDNFKLLAEAKRFIKEDDNLSFDMTHSFRSLAFYELLAINFFKLSMRNSNSIDFISYGMFEYKSYNGGKTPIIDQMPILRLLEWTKAADEYKRFGTTYLIDELVQIEEMTSGLGEQALLVLNGLGDAVTSNNLMEIRKIVENCHLVVADGTTGNHAIDFIFKDIDERFGAALGEVDNPEERTKLNIIVARWHLEKKRYIASAITVVETMVTYCAETIQKVNRRDDLKEALLPRNAYNHENYRIFKDFVKAYNKIRKSRNKLCHALNFSNEEELKRLRKNIEEVSKIFTNRLTNNKENIEKLKNNSIKALDKYERKKKATQTA